MKINSYFEDQVQIVDIDSVRIDAGNAPEFKDGILQFINGEDIIIDFRNLEFIDSSGLSALVYLHKQAQNNNISLKLVNLSPRIMDILKTTGLVQILQIYPDVESAKKDI